jgi:hypothetical protein
VDDERIDHVTTLHDGTDIRARTAHVFVRVRPPRRLQVPHTPEVVGIDRRDERNAFVSSRRVEVRRVGTHGGTITWGSKVVRGMGSHDDPRGNGRLGCPAERQLRAVTPKIPIIGRGCTRPCVATSKSLSNEHRYHPSPGRDDRV